MCNGTSNFMMTKMDDEGWSYELALKTAQELGYAESDQLTTLKVLTLLISCYP